jgi:magnesium transporter
MLMLSTLLRFRLRDASGRTVPVLDYGIDLLASDHPLVTHVRYHDHHRGLPAHEKALSWSAVTTVDWQEERLDVADLAAGVTVSAEQPPPPAEDVLLHRDVLDALILDLQNRRATRANDLALESDDHGRMLRLVAADLSFVAMLRRLTNGRAGRRVVPQKLFDWKYIEFLRGDPAAVPAGAVYHRRIARLPAGEIARLVDALPYLHAAELLRLLPDELAADTLEAMSAQRQLQVFEELEQSYQATILSLMAPDLATDLIRQLHTEAARELLSALPAPQAGRIIELLRYPEDTVGGIMTNDVVTVAGSLTIAEARHVLGPRLAEPDFIFFIFVVDDNRSRRLRGVLPLRLLLTAPETSRIEEVMNTYLVTLHALEGARAGAYRVLNSRLVALPVVGREGRLLGAVTIDDAVAQVGPQAWGSRDMRIFS